MIIPAAGLGKRFADAGYENPKPFIDVDGIPMVELVVRNLRSLIGECRVVVVFREEMRGFTLDRVDNCTVTYVPELTQGAANTVLHALQNVNDDEEVVIANSDQIVDFDPAAFESATRLNDGVIVTFIAADKNPKWSYAAVDTSGAVTEVAEKRPISDVATVGVYHYKTARMLKEAINAMIAADDRTNGEYYLCPAYNHVPAGTRVVTVETTAMHGLGTPEDLETSLGDANFLKLVDSLKSRKT